MFSKVFLWVTFVIYDALASPLFLNMVVLDQRNAAPHGFIMNGATSTEETVTLRVALHQNNLAGLETALYDVSTPENELYGLHLSKEEVEAFVSPTLETKSLVSQWLETKGIQAKTMSPAGDWVQFEIPIGKANTLINANFRTYTHVETGMKFFRTLSYSIPKVLQGHIDAIHPTTTFDNPFIDQPVFKAPAPIHNLPKNVTVEGHAVSAFPTTQTLKHPTISGHIQPWANQADFSLFRRSFQGSGNTTSTRVDKPDITQTMALSRGQENLNASISVWNNTQSGAMVELLDNINLLLAQPNLPKVLTTSYREIEQNISPALAIQICNAFMQLGARGTSILLIPEDRNVLGSANICSAFVPTFPSGCPFITSVGEATEINQHSAAISSSGGFSNVFARPSYQSPSILSYLEVLGKTNAGIFNSSGRAFPDVSSRRHDSATLLSGNTLKPLSASCLSPDFASVVSILNDQLLSVGKPPLGFLNIFLYSEAGQSVMHGITTGGNRSPKTSEFPSAVAWDPVTGLGTPNYAKLNAVVGL